MEHEEKKEHHEHHEHEKPEEHEKHEKAPEKHEQEKPASGEKREKASGTPSSESKELRDSRVSMIVFTLAGVAMALASSVLKSSGLSNYITATLGLVSLVVVLGFMQKMFKRKVKFFLSGAFAYVFVWLVFWIFLYNM